ncbi:sortase A [Seinonella peptonophila]|uniref:Sortase A n=1 Tax=Seinonella peptonophila TaxID=112248 RepID=A0A1M4T1R3_9BACL|nr:class D sortase [Seinonella peptonophila]SHE38227.1 sortase A [Seinonella peptonophila]
MKLGRWISLILFICGCILVVYSGYQWWGQLNIALEDPKLAQKIAKNWNDQTPKQSIHSVPPSSNQSEKNLHGSKVGELIIPRIGAILPIIEGTDPDSLEHGVGKFVGPQTVSPDQTGHVVLSGHRDTVFRKVGKLQIGDRLFVRYQGKIYTYQIRKTWVTNAEDLTVIVPQKVPILTLTTCYPFNYVGSAPDRYIIRSELIEINIDKK